MTGYTENEPDQKHDQHYEPAYPIDVSWPTKAHLSYRVPGYQIHNGQNQKAYDQPQKTEQYTDQKTHL
jgi:hypothetical protein